MTDEYENNQQEYNNQPQQEYNEEQQQEYNNQQQPENNEEQHEENNGEQQQQENNEQQQQENNGEQPQEENNEQQPQEENVEPPQEQKVYAPPNPTIKECIQLNQLLPVSELDKKIEAISSAIYENDDLLNEFLQKVDNRFKICNDDKNGPFIMCEQNRDGESYRSPYSNKYFPDAEGEARYPSKELRVLEEKLNGMFREYIKMYYSEKGIYSVYCWNLGGSIEDGFGVAVLIQNIIKGGNEIKSASWESSNLMEVTFKNESNKIKAKYVLTTSVNLVLGLNNKTCGNITLSGDSTKSKTEEKVIKKYMDEYAHIQNIGTMIEDMESGIRNLLDSIYCKKTQEIVDKSRINPRTGRSEAQTKILHDAFFAGMRMMKK